MAFVSRPCGVFPCVRDFRCYRRATQNGWTLKSTYDFIKTQLCTVAITLTLFSSVRLPKEAFKYGIFPYLIVYTIWQLVAGLPIVLLQLATGQLSQQDPVGVWRAVPILRGVGHLKLLTSYLCSMYYMVYVALVVAYLIWIGKGTVPLKDCTRLFITPNGYENKMNASECFNSTFLSPFTVHPQYFGIMAILIFALWFFVPIILYRQRKSLKVALSILAPITIAISIVLCVFLSDGTALKTLLISKEQWTVLYEPYIWQSALVQALLSSQVVSGYLISAGGSIYRHSDVRWTAVVVILINIISGWLWVLMWETISDSDDSKDTSFIAILTIIYQSSMSMKRSKQWPLLALGIVFVSGIISVLSLIFPVYDKLHRQTGDNWRLFAGASSAIGTALTVAVLGKGLDVAGMLDDLVTPVLAVFTAAVEVVGFVFIYGWCYLAVDIEFLTGSKLPCLWTATWWTTPFLLIGVTGWWLRILLRATWGQTQTLWPLVGAFSAILIVMIIMAAVAVAKEEQFNLLSKIASAFRSSRLWGPEEPMARYVWMSQRYTNEMLSNLNDGNSEPNNYPKMINTKKTEKNLNEDWLKEDITYQRNHNLYNNNVFIENIYPEKTKIATVFPTHSIPRGKKKKKELEKFRSPNVCLTKGKASDNAECNCNRHFKLTVPDLRNCEVSTSL